MNIVFDYPPNIEEIRKANIFELRPTCIFTYGDTIYNPGGGHIGPELEAHEATHTRQQGSNPSGWWKKYLADPTFRLEQEVAAYRNQYRKFITMTHDRNIIFKFVHRIACDLSGPLYGNIIEYQKAVKRIKS